MIRPRLIATLLAILFAVAGAVAQEQAAPAAPEESAVADAVSIEPKARDEAIEDRLRDILLATGWYRRIDVDVRDGVVFLDGVTDTDERRGAARDLATKTEDVAAVVNRIAVEPRVVWSVEPARRELWALSRSIVAAAPFVILALIILPLAWLAARSLSCVAQWALDRRVESPFLRAVIARTISVPVFLLGLYFVLQVAGLTQLALSIIGGAGVIGIIVGFAFRDIAENFLASLLLSIRQPFRTADYVRINDFEGIVHSMNTRSTVLLSIEGNHIQIPNATVFKSVIVNFSTAPSRREVIDVGIGYDVSIAAAQEIILRVLRDHEAVSDDPEPMALVDGLGASTVNIRAYYWFDGHRYSGIKVKSALLRLTKKALIENGISMPDEAREIIFPQGVPLVRLDEGEAPRTAPQEGARAAAARSAEPARTAAERDLENDEEEVRREAGAAPLPEGEANLLVSEEPPAKDR